MADNSLIARVRDRALTRPWLLAAPLLAMLTQGFIGAMPYTTGFLALKFLLTALTTSMVTALFAELWLGDGRGVDARRCAALFAVYILPYPLLMVFGIVSAKIVFRLTSAEAATTASAAAIYGLVGLGKVAALMLGAASSLAAARRAEAGSAWRALGQGFGDAARGAGFLVPAMIAVWVVQEACIFLSAQLAPPS
ncbi:MAG: hypothetical protein M0D55_12140 [Elusimicrobiota bacterium]|nr:MAG: hypothetical protein M0D55_12140 [Elusimicrobiota bacterium]